PEPSQVLQELPVISNDAFDIQHGDPPAQRQALAAAQSEHHGEHYAGNGHERNDRYGEGCYDRPPGHAIYRRGSLYVVKVRANSLEVTGRKVKDFDSRTPSRPQTGRTDIASH